MRIFRWNKIYRWALFIPIILLIACSTINQGIIVRKKHVPPASGIYMHAGSKYLIFIEGETEKGTIRTRRVRVTQEKFEELKIGDFYRVE